MGNLKLDVGFDPAYKYLHVTASAMVTKFNNVGEMHTPPEDVATGGIVWTAASKTSRTDRQQKKGLKQKLGDVWSVVSSQFGTHDACRTRSWDPSLRPSSSCLKSPSATPSICSETDSLDSDTFDALTMMSESERASCAKRAMTKSVSFSDFVSLHETYPTTKYRRKGYGKKAMTHTEIDQIIFEVNRYKALDMELHPSSFHNIHWMKKTVPGQPRMTELAMADLRRRVVAEYAMKQVQQGQQQEQPQPTPVFVNA